MGSFNARLGSYLVDHRALHIQVDLETHLNPHHQELLEVLTM